MLPLLVSVLVAALASAFVATTARAQPFDLSPFNIALAGINAEITYRITSVGGSQSEETRLGLTIFPNPDQFYTRGDFEGTTYTAEWDVTYSDGTTKDAGSIRVVLDANADNVLEFDFETVLDRPDGSGGLARSGAVARRA